MKDGEAVGAMPMKLADEGASGGALAGASRADLARGFTPLHDADRPDPFAFPGEGDAGRMGEGPFNEIFTEHDAGGFLERPHGLER